jgi:hypothetical protein
MVRPSRRWHSGGVKWAIFRIPTFIVRNKADQLIGNMVQDETDSSPGDDGYDWIYQEFKSKYIDATKSDFDMHKEVMAEVLFEDYPGQQWRLLRQRVYMVSAANVRSLMQAGVEKGGGASKSKNIDEVLLVEHVLREAVPKRRSARWSVQEIVKPQIPHKICTEPV